MATENFGKIEKKLRLMRQISPNQTWKQDSKTLLLSHFEQKQPVHVGYWRVAFAGLLLLLLVSSLTTIAAANSLPGELLYPIKRGYERAKLTFNRNEELSVHKTLVDKRVEELVRVVETNNQRSSQAIAEVENSVSDINKTVQHQRSKLQTLQQTGQESSEIKENLANLVPTIEQKQSQLSQIETALPQASQDKVTTIINLLENLKTTINATVDPEVKGIEDPIPEPQKRPLLQTPQ